MRIEKDSIGIVELPADASYGIHSYRSMNNFPSSGEKININLVRAYLLVKLAAAETNYKTGLLDPFKYEHIISAIDKLINECDNFIQNNDETIYKKIIVDPYQGGAGTSLNMNVNEVIANTALLIAGKDLGEYDCIHPLDDVNLSQSTNDTFVTALKIAALYQLKDLEESFATLQRVLQEKEKEFNSVIKLGRTQFQDAVPVTLGQEFGAWAQTIARDRWRLYNVQERLRTVNLGGTAVGNSVGTEKKYVLLVVNELKKITGLPIAKAEDLFDATQNLDVFVEAHGIIKAGACSLIKIANDIRFLSSGPDGGIGEMTLPKLQAGSSIMPGKVNPVIPEYVIQISEMIKGNDVIISNLVSAGNLELNAFAPMIAHLFLKSVKMLEKALLAFSEKCINGINANKEKCKENLLGSSAVAAFLINEFGYEKISDLVVEAGKNKVSFIELLKQKNILTEEQLSDLISERMGIQIEQHV
jgi:aspartate ammonia-lyase